MRFNLIDLLVIGALIALLVLAARQDFPHYATDTPAATAPTAD